MSDTSNRSFVELVRPVDPAVADVLRAVHDVAQSLDHECLLVGAAARDLLLVNALGLRPGRATRDIDFGIALASWEQFSLFQDRLIATGRFRATTGATQRLYYKAPGVTWEMPVDLIPFGPIASEGEIAWPPSRDLVMNVAGFEDALRSSVTIQVQEALVIRVASLAGLTVLKLLAWGDRGTENNKDVSDLFTLLSSYADAGNLDRLYEDELGLLESAEFDVVLAGAELLGRDVARISGDESSRRVREILDGGRGDRLLSQMRQVSDPFGDRVGLADRLFESFRRGVG